MQLLFGHVIRDFQYSYEINAVMTGHGGATSIYAGSIDELRLRVESMGVNPKVLDNVVLIHMVNKKAVDVRYPPSASRVDVPGDAVDYLMNPGNNPEGVQALWDFIKANYPGQGATDQ